MNSVLMMVLADGRTKPAAPRVVQYFVPSTGEVLDYCPDALSHPWPKDEILAHARKVARWINPERPSSRPYELRIHDLEAYDRLVRSGALREPACEVVDNRSK